MAEAMTASTPVAGATPCASAGAEANLATAERWSTEVWNNQDLDVLDEIVAPEILHHGAAFPDVSGIDGLKESLTRQFEAFPDIVINVDDAFAADDVAVVRWSGTATLGGDFLGETTAGTPANFTGVNVYRMECGKIVESWSEMNTLDVLYQIRDAAGGAATPTA
jgi:steroid delta-isomerase-like uncharacterized protein